MKRDERIIGILEKLNLDAILISNGCNMRYLSGFSGETGYLYLSGNRQILFTDSRYTVQAKQESKDYEVIQIEHSYTEAMNQILALEPIRYLGLEAKSLLHSEYLQMEQELKVGHLVPVMDEVTALRGVKTEYELGLLKQAEQIGDLAFSEILDWIKPGVTELEIAARLEFIMKTNGADGLSFDTIVASGIHSSMPHAVPTGKKIEYGDFVTMDFGCRYQGYCSDMTRTVVVGKASDRQKELYQTVLKAQTAALDFMKAGYKGQEIDAIARTIIYQAGYEGCFGHGLGHSVGLFIHESPRLSPMEESVILENMVITVEPGIYIEGFGGVRIEDMVAVKQEGIINFTGSEKKLIEL